MTDELLRLQIEGWRGISHSYALVNQFQLLHWRKHHLAQVSHADMPFILAHWANGENSAGFTAEDLELINGVGASKAPEALYRIYAPLKLEVHATLPTLTFAVTEFGLGTQDTDPENFRRYAAEGGMIHTPSQWSKRRLIANGIPEHIIHVIGHAVDPTYFHPLSRAQIEENRSNLGFHPEDVILLNVGTHHWNKGLDLLIKAFVQARETNKNLKLLLKDQRSTYLVNSESYVQQILSEMGRFDQDLVDSIRMISGHLTLAQLNSLYSVADAYVTPYRAEGFNLPALEAQACGTPVIATRGGATDDFLDPKTTTAITGALKENSWLKEDLPINAYIEPSLEELTHALQHTHRKSERSDQNRVQSWPDVCAQLTAVIRNEPARNKFVADEEPARFMIFCDGGIGNRINALVSGLAIARAFGLRYRIHWPVNNWCAAPFDAIFDNLEPVSAVSISGLKGMLDGADMLLHDDIASQALGVTFNSAYRFESMTDFEAQSVGTGKQIFYYPAIMPTWVPEHLLHEALRSLRFTAHIANAVRHFVSDVMVQPFHGLHLRRTDLNVGLSDEEVFKLVRRYPNERFYVCSDDPAAETLASAHPNVYHRPKSHHVEKKTNHQDWLAQKHDDDGRLYYGNIQRNREAVIEGTIDLLVLAHSQIVGYSGSTFQRIARLIGEVCPLVSVTKPNALPFFSNKEIERQLQANLLPYETIAHIANNIASEGDTPHALEMLEMAIEYSEEENKTKILLIMGIYLLKEKKPTKAEVYLDYVIQQQPAHFSGFLHLAYAKLLNKKEDLARDYLQKALDMQNQQIGEAERILIEYLSAQLLK